MNAKLPSPAPIQDFIVDIDNSEEELDGILANVLMDNFVKGNDLEVHVNIIAYISGFVARRLSSGSIKCSTCVSSLITDDENDDEFLIISYKRGGLFFPSRSVIEVCSFADKTFQH